MRSKVPDLDYCSRQKNIKFSGILESVINMDLKPNVCKLLKAILPEATEQDLIIDRAHNLLKSSFLLEQTHRDVLAIMHYVHIKQAMSMSRH